MQKNISFNVSISQSNIKRMCGIKPLQWGGLEMELRPWIVEPSIPLETLNQVTTFKTIKVKILENFVQKSIHGWQKMKQNVVSGKL